MLIERLEVLGLEDVQVALDPFIDHADAWRGTADMLNRHGKRAVSGMYRPVGEDYATLETIARTGGFVPDSTWEVNWHRLEEAAPAAAALGVDMVSAHAGFIPADGDDPAFTTLADRVEQIASLFAEHGLTLLLETGQESAETLELFLDRLHRRGRINIAVNFDPANMLLYGTGDPHAALERLLPHVRQVHIKDATPAAQPGTWGRETPIGQGGVDWSAFFELLMRGGYDGPLIIEREARPDHPQRQEELLNTITMLARLLHS